MIPRVLCDCRISKKIEDKLTQLGYSVMKIQKNKIFDEPISAHPDMNYFILNDCIYSVRTFVCCGKLLKYPDDVLLNGAVVGKDIICNREHFSQNIIRFAESNDYRIINVKQGYAKCNIALVSEKDKAVITEDAGIAETLRNYSYDVLKLDCHCVKLFPYEYGFIGGASGKLSENILAFTGRIEEHAEYDRIRRFCNKYEVEPISLSDEPLYDYGSIFVMR